MSNVRVLRSRLNPLRRRIRGSRLTFSTGERVFRRIGFAQAEKNPSQQIFPANDLARLSPPTDQSPVTESRYARITREKRDEQMYLSRINSWHERTKFIRFVSCSIDDDDDSRKSDEGEKKKRLRVEAKEFMMNL